MSLRSGYGSASATQFGLPGAPSVGPTYRAPAPISAPKDTARPGGFNFDFTQPTDSFTEITNSAARFVNTIPGGDLVTGAIGGVGSLVGQAIDFAIPGDLGLGDVAKGTGEALAWASNEMQRAAARDRLNQALGRSAGFTSLITDVAGGIGDLFTPDIQAEIEARKAGAAGQDPRAAVDAYRKSIEGLPGDLVARAKAGEDIETLAQEMIDRNIGFSSDPQKQMGAILLADPLNLVTFGLGRVAGAGTLVRAGTADNLNPVLRASGTVYNALTGGASRSAKALVTATIGPATSGVVRAYGAGQYAGFLRAAAKESPEIGAAAREYLDIGHTQIIRAVIGRATGKSWDPILREATASADELQALIAKHADELGRSPMIAKQIEDDADFLLRSTKPSVIGLTDAEVYEQTLQYVVDALKVPHEVAARMIGTKTGGALRDFHAIAYGMRWGRAVKDFVRLRDDILPFSRSGSRAVQTERLTPIANGTLTDKRVASALDDIVTEHPAGAPGLTPAGAGASPAAVVETYDMARVHEVVERFDDLRAHFAGRPYTAKQVVDYLRALRDGDGLVEELTSGLPAALRTWSADYGYGVGYAPKSGWKVIPDGEGGLIVTSPFVHVQSTATASRVRNPIGRLGDSLFAVIHQRQVVLSSENRLADYMVRKGFGSEVQARGIHKALLREASERNVTPRAMVTIPAKSPGKYENRIQEIFAEGLGDQYDEFIKVTNPEFAFFRAIAGNLSEVGWTQKLTGSIKAAEAKLGSAFLVRVSEGLYPKAKFSWNPFFQTQERVETVFWKVARGIAHHEMDPEVRRAILETFEADPNFRFLAEDFGAIFLHRGRAAAAGVLDGSGIRGKLGSITDVAGTKREATVEQVFVEYAEFVERAIIDIDPKLWQRMVAAAGTNDARTVVGTWIKERHALMDVKRIDTVLADVKASAADLDIHVTLARNLDSIRTEGLRGRTYFWQGGEVDQGAMAADLARRAGEAVGSTLHADLASDVARMAQDGDGIGAIAQTVREAIPGLRAAGYDADELRTIEGVLDDIASGRVTRFDPATTLQANLEGLTHTAARAAADDIVEIGIRPGFVRASVADPEFVGQAYAGLARHTDDTIPPEALMVRSPGGEWRPLVGKSGPAFSPDEETIWQAYSYGLRRAAQVARQTQYFREGRGFLERSLNHPILGLYPLSYASKVFMEFGRFLLKRPFGLNAPLGGAAAMNKWQQAVLVQLEEPDSGLADFVEQHPILLNFINQMLPYWPTQVSVNAPLWIKDIAAQAEAGKQVPESQRTKKGQNVTVKDIGRAINDQANLYLNPLRLFSQTIPGISEEIAESLFPNETEKEANPLTPYRQ